MRILYLIDSLKVGGAEILLLSMIRRYQDQGHQIALGFFTEGELQEDFINSCSLVRRISTRGLKDVRAIPRTIKLIREFQPDIIHTHLFKSDVVGQISAALLRVPVRISSSHNINPWRKNPLFSMIIRVIMGSCQRIIAVSQAVADYIIQWSNYPTEKVQVIDNGISLSYFDPESAEPLNTKELWDIDDNALTIGIIGRLHPQKGHDNFLRSAREIVDELPEARFVIVGDGSLRGEITTLRDELKLNNEVVFAGIQRDMPGTLASVDIVVFSSLWEGLPVALLEAMAMQRPIVSTEVGGIPDVIVNKENGILVSPNEPQQLADAVLHLARNPEMRDRLGKNARETVTERFGDEIMHQEIMELYSSLLGASDYARS